MLGSEFSEACAGRARETDLDGVFAAAVAAATGAFEAGGGGKARMLGSLFSLRFGRWSRRR